MLEILKETDRRLVLALGGEPSRRLRFIFDKDSGLAWLERRWPFGLRRTVELPLASIATIGTATVARGAAVSGRIILTTQDDRRHDLATDTSEAVRQAAQRIRAFLALTETRAQHTTHFAWPMRAWSLRVATGAALTVTAMTVAWLTISFGGFVTTAAGRVGSLVANAAARTQTALLLPECDAQQSRDTIQELVRDRLGAGAVLSDITQRGHAGGERLCSAIARHDGRTANVGYRNYWDGWTAKARLTDQVVTAKLDAARTDAIAAAAATFLAASRNSHVTGKPPRQTDPAIDQALAAVLATSDLAAEPLVANEIDKALDWLKTADQIGAVYLLAGTGFTDFAQVPRTELLQRRMRGNVTAFAAEFGRYTDFQMIALATIANAQMRANANAQGRPNAGQPRTDEIRTLVAEAMTSNFIALVYDGHDDGWRMARLIALGRAAPVAAKFLTREEAHAVHAVAVQTVDYFRDITVRARVREVASLLTAP
jgi:hypothetical protein